MGTEPCMGSVTKAFSVVCLPETLLYHYRRMYKFYYSGGCFTCCYTKMYVSGKHTTEMLLSQNPCMAHLRLKFKLNTSKCKTHCSIGQRRMSIATCNIIYGRSFLCYSYFSAQLII